MKQSFKQYYLNEMTRRLKELSKAISTNDIAKMQKLGKVDYEITGKHLTARNNKIVHKRKTEDEASDSEKHNITSIDNKILPESY